VKARNNSQIVVHVINTKENNEFHVKGLVKVKFNESYEF